MNIAELLKDCPKGMELDCTMYENVEFDYIEQNSELVYPIHCLMKINGGYNALVFTRNGCNDMHPNAKCVIFPKGKTTWEGFVPPCKFKDGDIIFTNTNALKCNLENSWVSIFKEYRNNRCACYVCLCLSDLELYHDKWEDELLCELCEIEENRLATEEEKQKLFDAIKANGYKWNPETKTLEKLIGPNFHEGDWIACEELNTAKILSINMDRYEVEFIDGNKGFPHIDYIDRNFHLWTIQDAKDGDVLAAYECLVLFKKLDGLNIKCYCTYHFMGHQSFYVDTLQNRDAFHPATKEQRDLLFQKMKEAGYKWNQETKTLEKLVEPKFKVGDRIRKEDNNSMVYTINGVYSSMYGVEERDFGISIEEQDEYELVPNKFDITTLKVFDKVLVRDHNAQEWVASLFSNYNEPKKYKYICVNGSGYAQCIPYEGNKHLVGTKNDCDEYYKTWE